MISKLLGLLALRPLDRYREVGLLILRVGIGLAFMRHGVPKLMAGPEMWAKLGGALGLLGIHFAPAFWGLMAALAEAGGGLLLTLGLFARPAAFFMFFTMVVAMSMHLHHGDDFNTYSHALEAGILFFSLVIIGPGRHSLDGRLGQA